MPSQTDTFRRLDILKMRSVIIGAKALTALDGTPLSIVINALLGGLSQLCPSLILNRVLDPG